MKKTYVVPRMECETFEPNEYVATCWKVGCSNNTSYATQGNDNSNAPYGNRWINSEGPYDRPFSHNGSCRTATNNYFKTNGTNVTFEFENNSEQGTLYGGLDYWGDVNNNNVIDSGDVIYWHTSNTKRTWNHWGYVESVDSTHINRS